MVTQVPLTKGHVALIDDEDAERVLAFKWHAWVDPKNNEKAYPKRNIPNGRSRRGNPSASVQTVEKLGNFIMRVGTDVTVSPKDGNQLNLVKSNLVVTKKHSKVLNIGDKFRGIDKHTQKYKDKTYISYRAYVSAGGKKVYLGSFRSPEEAALVHDAKAKELLGDAAILNFPDDEEDVPF